MKRERVTLYRVQSLKDGRGPWKPGFSESWLDNSRNREQYDRLIPWQTQFLKAMVLRKKRPWEYMGCGCVSPEQLKLWFTQLEIKTLIPLGYQAVTFNDARILASSDIQCIFARPQPLHVGVEPFNLYEQHPGPKP